MLGSRHLPGKERSYRTSRREAHLFFALAGVLVCLGTVLRVQASFTELWQDEIWSLILLRDVTSPIDIVTKIHESNNHILNSLFLYFLGDHTSWLPYRLLSLVSGIGSILVAGAIARRWGRLEALTAVALFSTSFLLVLYSSEARGYMPEVFFALVAFLIAEDYGTRPALWSALSFSLAVMLGFLSHLTFAFAYFGLVQWMLWKSKNPRFPCASIANFLVWNGAPLLFLSALYLINIRTTQHGGVYENISLSRSLHEVATLPLGLATTGPGMVVGLIFCFFVIAVTLRLLNEPKDDRWVFFVTILALPSALLVVVGATARVWYLRYALAPIAVFYIVLAIFLCRQYRRHLWGKFVYVAVLLVFFIGNGWRIAGLCTVGRGHYLEALRYMAEHTAGDTIRVTGDHHASITTTLWFYRRYVPGKSIVYDVDRDGPEPPAWFIVALAPGDHREPGPVTSGREYTFERAYDCFDSGYRWLLYRRSTIDERGGSRPSLP